MGGGEVKLKHIVGRDIRKSVLTILLLPRNSENRNVLVTKNLKFNTKPLYCDN